MFTDINNSSWNSFFTEQQSKLYFSGLLSEIDAEYANYTCFPPKHLIFNAFNACNFSKLKVVIIGQDPYHGDNEANGLCFSVNDGVKIPPSLKNIFIEVNNQYERIFTPTSGNLDHWAKQGVLLLNASLTVRKDLPNSHKHLPWLVFTDAVIEHISENSANVVFLLWGSFAHKKGKKIDRNKHLVLKTGHPSPLSANRGFWFGNNHFIATNDYLKANNRQEIKW